MPHYLSDDELKRTAPAEIAAYRGPVPTQIVSNGAEPVNKNETAGS